MKKFVLFLVIVAVLGWGGFKAGAWFGGYRWLEAAEEQVREQAVLQWGGVGSSIEGRLLVKQPVLRLFALSEPLEGERIGLAASDPVSLLSWLWLEPDRRPHPFTVTFEGLRLKLREDLFKDWVVAEAESDGTDWNPWHLRHCGAMRLPGTQDLLAIGVEEAVADGELSLESSPEGQVMRLDVDTRSLGSLEMTYVDSRLPSEWSAWTSWPWLQWQSLELVLRDGGLMRRLAAYCGTRNGLEPTQWARREAESLAAALASRGLKVSRQWVALYAKWLAEGGELTVSLPATGAAGLSSLPAWAAYFGGEGVKVAYNGQSVPDLNVVFEEKTYRQVQEDKKLEEEEAARASEEKAPEPATMAMRDTPLYSADHWVQRMVRVKLSTGRTLEGRLTRADESTLEVTQEVGAGGVAYPVRIDRVERFEVRRLPNERAPLPPQTEEPSTPIEGSSGQ